MKIDPGACIPDEELIRLFEGRLSPEEQAKAEAHLDACGRCFDLVGELARGLHSTPKDPSADDTAGPSATSISGILARAELLHGRYQILDVAGVGGMGVIYAAYDHTLDRRVALKVVRQDRRPDDGGGPAEARLLREAKILARLSHPNIVVVYDVTQGEEGVFIAMELVAGQTLRAWLAGAPAPSQDEILRVFVDAGRGLAAAHAAGVVHRDFKP